MDSHFYLYFGVVILLMTMGRVVWRHSAKKIDWEVIVAFIRLEFPPAQRDVAQKIAAGLAEIVGLKIKQLRPEYTLSQIVGWADDPVSAASVSKLLQIAYGVKCDGGTTFRELVEKIVEHREKNARPGARQ